VFKAHSLLHHSTLGLGLIKKKREKGTPNRVIVVLPVGQENILILTILYVPYSLDVGLHCCCPSSRRSSSRYHCPARRGQLAEFLLFVSSDIPRWREVDLFANYKQAFPPVLLASQENLLVLTVFHVSYLLDSGLRPFFKEVQVPLSSEKGAQKCAAVPKQARI